ncbi:Intraflagellar transport protein 25 [Liparis tanakae]|uniref:Intraflagellar transport protein 25 n=1 Tax=Liparis tanakae TaxID=230148 RepID=A0A4Z2GC08_9TELE|nr:Intraflagellar transport protein 25 [Liparis tanakae]
MIDSSLSSAGAKVVVASSSDENHPPENITDGNTNTFWMSTGMFPQELIVRFADSTQLSAVTVDCYNVKHLKIEKNSSQTVSQFEPVTEQAPSHAFACFPPSSARPSSSALSSFRLRSSSWFFLCTCR